MRGLALQADMRPDCAEIFFFNMLAVLFQMGPRVG